MDERLKKAYNQAKIGNKRYCAIVKASTHQTESDLLNRVAEIISSGFEVLIFENNIYDDKYYLKLSKKIKQLCEELGATFIIKNRTDIAFLSCADGVYLDESAIDIHSAREVLGEEKLVGMSAETKKDAINAVKGGVDYIFIERICSTPTEPVFQTGLEYAKWVSENIYIPAFAAGDCVVEDIDVYLNNGLSGIVVDTTNLPTLPHISSR